MRGCANVTFRRTLTFDLATVTLTLKILSAQFLSDGYHIPRFTPSRDV
jgi:hypothetical protein